MKPSRLQAHLHKKHPGKAGSDIAVFRKLKETFEKRTTHACSLFTKKNTDSDVDSGLVASYNISRIIAKCGKSHTVGETLVLPCVSEVLTTVLKMNAANVLKSIPLSNSTVSRRIDEMGNDIESQLCVELRKNEFGIQLDESTVRDNEALLMAYVRFIKEGKAHEEMLFCRSVKTNTKGKSLYEELKTYLMTNNIPITNISACATDGAPSMTGRHAGLIAFMKKEIPSLFAIHCVIHRQHLVAIKLSLCLHSTLSVTISVVNKIKAHSLNNRLFRQLCQDNEEEFDGLLHTEVHWLAGWLSKGSCLKRFFNLFDSIIEFLQSVDNELCQKILPVHGDVAYLADNYDKMNMLNLQLQGDNFNLLKAKTAVSTFIRKLDLFRQNIGRRVFLQFPSMSSVEDCYSSQDLEEYCMHLPSLKNDFEKHFEDLIDMNIPVWVMNPFICKVEEQEIDLQEEIIELQNDEEAKQIFDCRGYHEMWLHQYGKFPVVWKKAKLFFIAFPSSYIVERGFSAVSHILTKKRNRLDIVSRGDLRLFVKARARYCHTC